MISTLAFVPKEIADRIKDTAVLEDIIRDFTELKKSGASLIGNCPHCHAKKFTVTPGKKIYKCYSGCEKGGTDAIKFLTDVVGKTYQETLLYLADRYNISVQDESEQAAKKSRGNRKLSFRDEQLRNSGISDKSQKWILAKTASGDQVEIDRYQAATVDKSWKVVGGDDMILHYVDLNSAPTMYKSDGGKSAPFIRVRRANPALHLDKNGKPKRYESPWKSGNHLWFPNVVIDAYQKHQIIETLYVIEGEKKADKMCLHGMLAVGVAGIHNFAIYGDMPQQFELLIKRCAVANIVFVLDSDWQNLSTKGDEPVDVRPKTFFHAVVKFRDYFYAYHRSGIELKIYFAHGKSIVHKGVDDLLVYELKEKEDTLQSDFEDAMKSRDGEGKLVNVYNITDMSTYKLKEFWHLHSTPAFLNHYKEELKKLREFTISGLRRRYNPESDEFELLQKILPHEQFWSVREWQDKRGNEFKKYEFLYQNALNFLYNRGYGLYTYAGNEYRFIQLENRVVRETTPLKVRHFMLDITREEEQRDVVELLLRGGKQYLGPDNLSNLPFRDLRFMQSDKDTMYLYFKNCYWKITKDDIEQGPISELPEYIWESKIIPFEPKLVKEPLIKLGRDGDYWKVETSDLYNKSDIALYYERTSFFGWKNLFELTKCDDGRTRYTRKPLPNETNQKIAFVKQLEEDTKLTHAHMVGKMIGTGYMLHDYIDYSALKSVIAMDGTESEVGRSKGGSGKSIFFKLLSYLSPIEIIDGKSKNLEDDNHLYENVDERTQAIIFDDVRVNFSFESLFSIITTGLTINGKGVKRFTISPRKVGITTNHALNGEDDSFVRRQYFVSFSDYYNKDRRVSDDFGRQLFHEWDNEQWNLFYNWMASCIQTYLKYGLDYTVPGEVLERRKIRQKIGENFLSWASMMYTTERDKEGEQAGIFLNRKLEKTYLTNKYLEHFPNDRRYMDPRIVKEKLQAYAEYARLLFNPTTSGERIKSNGKEYIIIGEQNFDAPTQGRRAIANDYELENDMKDVPF